VVGKKGRGELEGGEGKGEGRLLTVPLPSLIYLEGMKKEGKRRLEERKRFPPRHFIAKGGKVG